MRKLTGYIGAMIIVIALMGSILAGYALNVNGTSTVMNEYEKVTDVSGLYTHSQEPSYIEYNPASNYIGYNVEQSGTFTINNNSSLNHGLSYKLYKGTAPNCAWNNSQWTSGAFYVNGGVVPYLTAGDQVGVSAYFTVIGDTVEAYIWQPDGTSATNEIHINDGRYWSANFTITYSSGTVTFNLIDNGVTLSSACNWLLMPNNNGDYVPILNGDTGYYQYNDIYHTGGSLPATPTVINEWNGQPVYNLYSITNDISHVWVLVPKTVKYQPTQDIGINYTESNRVNNYPIETDYDTSTTTSTASMDLMAVSVANQFNGSRAAIYVSNSNGYSGISYVTNVYSYKLSDLMQLMNIPANTTAIKFDCPSGVYNISVAKFINGQTVYFGSYFLNNYAVITGPDTGIDRNPWQDNYTFSFDLYASQYVMYYPDTQICELFDKDGVKIGNYSGPDKIFITFVTNTTNDYPFRTQGYNADGETQYSIPARPKPFMNIFYSVTGTITNVHYSDITKGYSIKSSNTSNVIWDNQYINGNIQLLFRAEGTPATYHNDLIVGSDTISIDYNTNRYSVTLNGGDPVDIGTWRNIVLDIDMINGELSVIPVRTFNSYTNVELDNTNIFVGDLVNPAPTNTIQWVPTSNSLTFNVYSTSVFMDTYGVVMVNPTLNITDYFTNLDNFYQLKLSNISVIGQSMTINGVTGIVTGNTISFNDETIQIKDMAITYADGHAYISDSHATIDLGTITDNNISMSGAWYFITDLMRGYTTQKMIYEWDWQDFILDNVQFCVIYIGLALMGLLIARHYCTLTITDYAIFLASIVIALTVQVIA